MKHKTAVLFIILCTFFCVSLSAESHIVLFQQSEISVSSMEHGAFTNLLQSSNKKSLDQLEEWMGTRGLRASFSNLWLVRGAVLDLSEGDALKLKKEPWVRGVYRNQVRRFVSPLADLKVGNTLGDVTEEPGKLWGLEKIGVQKIHSEFPNLDGKGIRVGVLDTGIQSRHPEFRNAKVAFKDFVNSLAYPYDDHGHGTHVGGTIAGGEVGIAPRVSMLFAKVFTASGSGTDSEILAAMQWVFDPDGDPSTDDYAQIVSNSWGADLTDQDFANIDDFAPFHEAVLAWIHGGIIPVFASGNSGLSPNGFPGGFPEVIAVGAMDVTGEIAPFSSRGPNMWRMNSLMLTILKPDITAPGVQIPSAFPGNKYASWAGTSMATPHVTGAVALALEGNPKLKLPLVKEMLLKSSEKKVDTSFGYGVLNAYQFVKMALQRR